MYIYLDPDDTSADRDRFYWKRAAPAGKSAKSIARTAFQR
jgi:hypothetical protein